MQDLAKQVNGQVVEDGPRHCIEILGREDRPDEKMRPQDRACSHNRQ